MRILVTGGAGYIGSHTSVSYTHLQAWRDPWSDVDDIGYQAAQSLFAIGTGGWFGMGLYQGMPEKIPVVDKDFIFSAVSEELGGIYALCLLFICVGCFLQFMLIATKMQAMFYKLIAFGLGTVYITQVFLTIGGATKFIPSTGVTLPLSLIHILFVDEIHRLNRQVEEVLYPAMEDFAIDIMLGKDSAARSIRLELPRFTPVSYTHLCRICGNSAALPFYARETHGSIYGICGGL